MPISFILNCLIILLFFSVEKKIGRSYQAAKKKVTRIGFFLAALTFILSYFGSGGYESSGTKGDPFMSLLLASHDFALWMAAIFAVSMFIAVNQKENKN